MSKSNRAARKNLERKYGKGCFFKRAKCAERIEEMGGIKTFHIFVKEKKYKGKSISHQITYHHLKHRSEGGRTSEENGANVEEIAHQYMHSLPREQEEVINDMLREFKLNCVVMTGNGEIQQAQSISIDFGGDVLVIPLEDNTPECNPEIARIQAKERALQRQEEIRELKSTKEYKQTQKYNRLNNPSRAMNKRDLQRRIEEEEGWEI